MKYIFLPTKALCVFGNRPKNKNILSSFVCMSHLKGITINISQWYFTDHLNNSYNHFFVDTKENIKNYFIKMRLNFAIPEICIRLYPDSENPSIS